MNKPTSTPAETAEKSKPRVILLTLFACVWIMRIRELAPSSIPSNTSGQGNNKTHSPVTMPAGHSDTPETAVSRMNFLPRPFFVFITFHGQNVIINY